MNAKNYSFLLSLMVLLIKTPVRIIEPPINIKPHIILSKSGVKKNIPKKPKTRKKNAKGHNNLVIYLIPIKSFTVQTGLVNPDSIAGVQRIVLCILQKL